MKVEALGLFEIAWSRGRNFQALPYFTVGSKRLESSRGWKHLEGLKAVGNGHWPDKFFYSGDSGTVVEHVCGGEPVIYIILQHTLSTL